MDGSEAIDGQAEDTRVKDLERELAAAKDAVEVAQGEAGTWRATAHATHAVAIGTMLGELFDAMGWDEQRCAPEGPIEYARRMRSEAVQSATFLGALAEIRGAVGTRDDEPTVDAVRRRLANNAVEIETLRAGLRALANVRDEGAVETARWRDRALVAERDTERRAEEVGLWRVRALEAESADRAAGDELFAKSVALVEQVEILRTAVRAARVRAQKAERNAEGYHNDADVLSGDLDEAHAKLDEVAALRGERDDLLVQLAAKTRETEEAQRERDAARHTADDIVRFAEADLAAAQYACAEALAERDAVFAAGLGIEAERAQAVAILNEDENDPETPCRCGQLRGACRSCLASAVYKAEDVGRDVRAALKAAGVDTDELAPEELGGVVVEKLDELAAKIDEVGALKAERVRLEAAVSERDEADAELGQIASLLHNFDDETTGADPIALARRCLEQERRNTDELCEVINSPGLHILAEDGSSVAKAVQRAIGERDLAVSFARRGWEETRRWYEEAKTDGSAYSRGRAEGGADVAARLRAIIDPEGHWNIDGLLGRVQALQEQAAAGESTEALQAAQRDLTEIEGAVTRHLEPLIDKEERGPAVRVIIEAASALHRARDQVRSSGNEARGAREQFKTYRAQVAEAWAEHLAPRAPALANEIRAAGEIGDLPVTETQPTMIERLRALLDPEAGLVRLDDDGLIERVRDLLDVAEAAGEDRRSADMAIANVQRERDAYKRQADCASPEGCGECLACVHRENQHVRALSAEVAHLKAKRATSDEERDQARTKLGRVVALCEAELEHAPSLLSMATRSLAWVLLREVAPELADRVGTPAPAPAAKPVDGYPPSGALDPEPVAKDVGGPEVAPPAQAEASQATETLPDPGEGWRLLGPLEVIEEGDEWRRWGGAWREARFSIGSTPAYGGGVVYYRRRIAAPVAPAAVVEPSPVVEAEVAIEARGSKFVIVRRTVTT